MDKCNENTESFAKYFGNAYQNPNSVGGTIGQNKFLTGDLHFTVREIEIFEILE
jgi:hypothetical protein